MMTVGRITQLTIDKGPLPKQIAALPPVRVQAVVLASAFLDGRAAFKTGVKVGDNPWPDTDERHWEWMQGWAAAGMDARRQNTKLTGAMPEGDNNDR
jgi:hypothetical protein